VAVVGYPAAQRAAYRAHVRQEVEDIATEIRNATARARATGLPRYVQVDFDGNRVVTWRETGAHPGYSLDDVLESEVFLPMQLRFWGPADPSPEGPHAVEGMTPQRYVVLQPSGRIGWSGALRLGDGRGNFLQVDVAAGPRAYPRIEKWNPDLGRWEAEGSRGQNWDWY
jgi:hypothetical protein